MSCLRSDEAFSIWRDSAKLSRSAGDLALSSARCIGDASMFGRSEGEDRSIGKDADCARMLACRIHPNGVVGPRSKEDRHCPGGGGNRMRVTICGSARKAAPHLLGQTRC